METLLEEIKNYLDNNFTDEESDKKLAGIIKRGISYLSEVAGTDIKSELLENEDNNDTFLKQLFFDYCRYARANEVESFKNNFKSELIMLRAKKDVDYYYEKQSKI